MERLTAEGPLDVNGWHEPTARLRRLQRLQVVILAVLCLGSVVVVAVLGRSTLVSYDRQRETNDRLQRLMLSSDSMIAVESRIWRSRAEGTALPVLDFLTSYRDFRQTALELADERTGGDTPEVVDARARVVGAIHEVDRISTAFITDGDALHGDADTALRRVAGPADDLRAGMTAWISAAVDASNAADASNRSQVVRLRWTILAILGLVFLSGLWLWLMVDRARARLIRSLEESEERFRSLVKNSSDAVMLVDPTGTIRYASDVADRLFGISPKALVGTSIIDLVAPEDTSRMSDFALRGGDTFTHESPVTWLMRCPDGSLRYIESVGIDQTDDDSVRGIVINSRDVTDRREMELMLEHRAFHDTLTDLANRALFENRVDHALAAIPRSDAMAAVLLVDLDDFKTVNDSLGHQAGDAMLIEIANRLRSALRSSDTAARLGGDEFAVLVESCTEVEEIQSLADRITRLIREPILLEGHELVIRSSIGIATDVTGEATANSMMRDADVAMYAAKAHGGGGWAVYESSMNERASERLGLINDLHRAMGRDELFLDYQPIVNLRTGRIAGMEALLRWRSPERGSVSPLEFIGLAEETGLIRDIGTWVLDTAISQMAIWLRTIPDIDDVRLAVNVSIRQFEDPGFSAVVAGALLGHGVPGRQLTLEVTEHALARDHEAVRLQMAGLKDLGVTLAIDDFGTGYSSLAYLANLPIDIVKIDRGFVEGLRHGFRDMRIAEMIVRIGQSLQLTTVAEGVEDEMQLGLLRELGCANAQGFHYSRPTTPDAMGAMLRDGIPPMTTASRRDPGKDETDE